MLDSLLEIDYKRGHAAARRVSRRIRRGVLCTLSFLTIVDRVAISAAKTSMSRALVITDTAFGWIFAAFAIGYTLMMIPSGFLADRYGPRKTLALNVLLWSILKAATGWVNGTATLLWFASSLA